MMNRNKLTRATVFVMILLFTLPLGMSEAQSAPILPGTLSADGDPIGGLIPVGPDATTIYATGEQGLYRSDDGAKTWHMAGPVPPARNVVAALDDPLLLLAGEKPSCLRAAGDSIPLRRSEDGGATWEIVPGMVDIRPLAIWGNGEVALGASCSGSWISTDAGVSWQELAGTGIGDSLSSFAVVATTDPSRRLILAARTSEGGTTNITRLDLTDPTKPIIVYLIENLYGIVPLAGRDDLYMAGAVNGIVVGTVDEGTRQSRRGLEAVTVSTNPIMNGTPDEEEGRRVNGVAIDPRQPDHLYAGTADGLFESFDLGQTWQRVAGIEGPVGQIVIVTDTDRLLVQTEAGVVVLVDAE